MKKLLVIAAVAILTVGCATNAPLAAPIVVDPYGFWGGLWHGYIIIFSFIGSLFDPTIAIYSFNNNGAFYNLGFVIGARLIGATARSIHQKHKRN